MADKLDPFDVEALERAVNNSATRVSTIWISFLIFSLYLLIAATTVTQRQLLLAGPLKLPVLNIDLPLWGFFFLAPILFVILHAYVLLQVLLLGRTTAAYNAAVARLGLSPEENTSLRQRLANTIFAQIFAGSPREREGLFGWILRLMAWLTLAIGPVAVLLVFEFAFLPYHSHMVTWSHRLLIAFDLLIVLLLWTGAFDPQRDVDSLGLLNHWKSGVAAGVLFLAVSIFPTFPGEFHAQWTRYAQHDDSDPRSPRTPPPPNECTKRSVFHFLLSLNFDRLMLARQSFVDEDLIAKIEKVANDNGLLAYNAPRTLEFSYRNLDCADFQGDDLRQANFNYATAAWARFDGAELQGASFNSASLGGASFELAHMQGASLASATLYTANLTGAQLQGASLEGAALEGGSLDGARLQAANLQFASLQGASLDHAQLQGAILNNAVLHAASLFDAQAQASSLFAARLQGAFLDRANLQAASFDAAWLQATSFDQADVALASFSSVRLWMAAPPHCDGGNGPHIDKLDFEDILDVQLGRTSDDAIGFGPLDFIDRAVAAVPKAFQASLRADLERRLVPDSSEDLAAQREQAWSNCAKIGAKISVKDHRTSLAKALIDLVCSPGSNQKYIARQAYETWISSDLPPSQFQRDLTRGFLGLDGKSCSATAALGTKISADLQSIAAAPAQ